MMYCVYCVTFVNFHTNICIYIRTICGYMAEITHTSDAVRFIYIYSCVFQLFSIQHSRAGVGRITHKYKLLINFVLPRNGES